MAAEILTSTKDMPREEWLEHRRSGIGGSDTPVIVLGNDHPFTSPAGAVGAEGWYPQRR